MLKFEILIGTKNLELAFKEFFYKCTDSYVILTKDGEIIVYLQKGSWSRYYYHNIPVKIFTVHMYAILKRLWK